MTCRGCQKTRVNTNENESNCLIQVWEGLQVELQGRYSIERFREIVAHAETSSLAWNILFIFAAPLPTLASLLVAEALPLQAPSAGLWHQTPGTYLRVVLVASLGMVCVPRQIQQSAPAVLPFSVHNTVLLCAIPAILMVLCFGALGAFWIFPTPFNLFFMGSVAPPVVVTSLWSIWKERLQKNPEASAKVFRFLKVFLVQSLLLTTYIAYYIIFLWVDKANQPYVSVLLPLIKLTFKNMARSGLYYMEDLAPIIIVANVDVFHTAFVCRTMQQTQGNGAVAFIMTVDIMQSLVAYYEVCSIVRRANALAHESHEAEIFANSNNTSRVWNRMTSRIQ